MTIIFAFHLRASIQLLQETWTLQSYHKRYQFFFHRERNHNIGPYCAYPSKHSRFNSNKVIFASRQFSTISSSKLSMFQSDKKHWLSITKLSFFILIPTLLYDGWLETEPSQILNYPFKPKTWHICSSTRNQKITFISFILLGPAFA